MNLALSTTLHTNFADAVERTRKALSEQGFGVLTEIDMKATLKAKLGEEMEDYLILGACNPPLAHRAVEVDRQIGLLLPCNVIVRQDLAMDNSDIAEAMNPQVMVQVTGEAALEPIAADATTKLRSAIASLHEDINTWTTIAHSEAGANAGQPHPGRRLSSPLGDLLLMAAEAGEGFATPGLDPGILAELARAPNQTYEQRPPSIDLSHRGRRCGPRDCRRLSCGAASYSV